MLVIPAIDLRAGRCVRLLRGDFARETVYGDNPVEVARRWREVAKEAELVGGAQSDTAGQFVGPPEFPLPLPPLPPRERGSGGHDDALAPPLPAWERGVGGEGTSAGGIPSAIPSVPLLHVVDLDGAKQGRPVQLDVVRRIAAVAPLQAGGGLRTEEDVARALEVAERVVLGTAAVDRALIGRLAERYGDRLVVALDTRDGMVAVQGWTEASGRTLLDLARELLEAGVRRFLHTDVERDGTLTSPNYASLEALIRLGAPVIASGGVASLESIRRLREVGAEAVIAGRALYEGTVDLREAIEVAR